MQCQHMYDIRIFFARANLAISAEKRNGEKPVNLPTTLFSLLPTQNSLKVTTINTVSQLFLISVHSHNQKSGLFRPLHLSAMPHFAVFTHTTPPPCQPVTTIKPQIASVATAICWVVPSTIKPESVRQVWSPLTHLAPMTLSHARLAPSISSSIPVTLTPARGVVGVTVL